MTPKQEDQMSTARRPASTSRRGFLHNGAMLAGALVAPTGYAGVAEAAAPRSPVRFAQAGPGTTAPSSGVTTKSTRLVGSPVNYAYAVKAGPWVFLNGHEAFDFEHGLSPEVEGPPG
jgi:hypothetical protein